jgi:cell volume regulation protein A
MTDALTIFSVVGAIIAIGFLSNVLFRKTGFPDTLFLILIGIILGPLLGVVLREDMLPVTPFLTTLTLMMILFEGGLNMEIYKVLSQSLRSAILAVLYIVAAAAFVTLFSYFVLGFGWLESLLLAPMTAGTSSVVIIPLVTKLSINDEVGVTLSLESTITDVLNIVLAITFLQMYTSGLVNATQVASTIVTRFAVGAVLGFVVGLAWIKVLGITRKQEFTYMLTIAALILCYVASEVLGGSGALSALLFGLVLGNHTEIYNIFSKKTDLSYMPESKNNLKNIQRELSFLIRAFFFVFLGLVYLPQMLGILFAGVIVATNIVLRYAAVTIATFKSEMYRYRKFMTMMCGTGLANAALSVLVYNTLTTQSMPNANAYMYPLIVANIIIITNIITSIAPILLKVKQNEIAESTSP